MLAWLSLCQPKDSKISNAERYGDLRPDVSFEYSHLPVFLAECGTVIYGFDSLLPLPWSEIVLWAHGMNINLSPFEATAIRKMSLAYVGIANDPDADCPIDLPEVQDAISEINLSGWMAIAKSAQGTQK